MKKTICFALITLQLLAILSLGVAADESADTYWTTFIEAEDCVPDSDWSMGVEENADAIGGKVLSCFSNEPDADGDGFTLTFTVPKKGNYMIWGRVFAPDQTSNSLHYRLDGDAAQIWDFIDEDGQDCGAYDSWYYMYLTFREDVPYDENEPSASEFTQTEGQWRHSPYYLALDAGEHSIHFTGREYGWSIDQFVITEAPIEAYDPNACTGNDHILGSCKFCNNEIWKHYIKDIYSLYAVTPEQYLEDPTVELIPVSERETETVAETTAAEESTTAPDTTAVPETEAPTETASQAETTAAANDGCQSVMTSGYGAICLLLLMAGACICRKKSRADGC